jgi:hypothetical protein
MVTAATGSPRAGHPAGIRASGLPKSAAAHLQWKL